MSLGIVYTLKLINRRSRRLESRRKRKSSSSPPLTRLRKKLLKQNKLTPCKFSKDRIGLYAEASNTSARTAVTYSEDNKQRGEAVSDATHSPSLDADCVVEDSLHCGVTDTASIESSG